MGFLGRFQANLRGTEQIDLLDIALHISAENIAAADEFAHEIDDKFSLLAAQPEMGRARPELGKALRSFVVKNYIIFYDPIPEGIFVIRVLHGARDIGNAF